ncbi:MAG: hypothetical protein WAR77_15130 [Saprospiraceae bacterium]|nr:hypothetical protein [Saprospiraceae bacterium]
MNRRCDIVHVVYIAIIGVVCCVEMRWRANTNNLSTHLSTIGWFFLKSAME